MLDVSLDKNRDALVALLEQGASRHATSITTSRATIPAHANLETHIDTDAETCTGLIVDASPRRRPTAPGP